MHGRVDERHPAHAQVRCKRSRPIGISLPQGDHKPVLGKTGFQTVRARKQCMRHDAHNGKSPEPVKLSVASLSLLKNMNLVAFDPVHDFF